MNDLEKKIRKILINMGCDVSLIGFDAWSVLIKKAYNDYIHSRINKKIILEKYYKILSNKYSTTRTRLERNLRTVILNNQDGIKEYFNYDSKITIKLFLMMMLNELITSK